MNRRGFLAALGMAPLVGDEIRRTYVFAPAGGWGPIPIAAPTVFQYSLDGGLTWSRSMYADGVIVVPDGPTIEFPKLGRFQVGDEYCFSFGSASYADERFTASIRRCS